MEDSRGPAILKLMAAVAVPKETEISILELDEFVRNTRLVPKDFCFKDLIVKLVSNKEPIISNAITEGQLAVIHFHFTCRSVLAWAARCGYLSIVEFLAKNGADLHAYSESLNSLELASLFGHLKVVEFLVNNGADLHVINIALQTASMGGYLPIVEFLLKNGANIHYQSNHALLDALCNGHLEVVKFLVNNGANIHAHRDFALRFSAAFGNLQIVKFLIEYTTPDSYNINYIIRDALEGAEKKGHTEVVEFLRSKLKTINTT